MELIAGANGRQIAEELFASVLDCLTESGIEVSGEDG